MAKHPLVSNNDLYVIASYLAQPAANTEIHAELPKRHQQRFEDEYRLATHLEVPTNTEEEPYYVWPEGTDKYGRELRIYFTPVQPIPQCVENLRSKSKWFAKREQHRINHSNLVMQLFQCGFVLGSNSHNQDRISEFMRRVFPEKHQ